MTTTAPYAVLAVKTSDHMRPEDRARLDNWLASVGVDPTRVVALAVAVSNNGWDLHVSEVVVDEHGRVQLDWALNRLVTAPRTLPLGTEQTWPDINTWSAEQ